MSARHDGPLVSVVVPVYKAEKLLPKCVDSILAQTYQNIQLILIDDGSPDSSGQICDAYAQKDQRVLVKHTANQGVSAARNEGIALADGEYLAFVDSDDYLSPGFLAAGLHHLADGDADLFISGLVEEFYQDDKLVKREENKGPDRRYTVRQLFNAFNIDYPFLLICGIWCKLYRMRIIKEKALRFDEQVTLGEDMLFLCDYLDHAGEVAFSSEVFYHYFRGNPDSLFSRYYPNMYEINVPLYERMLRIMREKGCDTAAIQRMEEVYVRVLIGCIYHEVAHQEKSTPASGRSVIRKVASHPLISQRAMSQFPNFKDKILMILMRAGAHGTLYRLLSRRHGSAPR